MPHAEPRPAAAHADPRGLPRIRVPPAELPAGLHARGHVRLRHADAGAAAARAARRRGARAQDGGASAAPAGDCGVDEQPVLGHVHAALYMPHSA